MSIEPEDEYEPRIPANWQIQSNVVQTNENEERNPQRRPRRRCSSLCIFFSILFVLTIVGIILLILLKTTNIWSDYIYRGS